MSDQTKGNPEQSDEQDVKGYGGDFEPEPFTDPNPGFISPPKPGADPSDKDPKPDDTDSTPKGKF